MTLIRFLTGILLVFALAGSSRAAIVDDISQAGSQRGSLVLVIPYCDGLLITADKRLTAGATGKHTDSATKIREFNKQTLYFTVGTETLSDANGKTLLNTQRSVAWCLADFVKFDQSDWVDMCQACLESRLGIVLYPLDVQPPRRGGPNQSCLFNVGVLRYDAQKQLDGEIVQLGLESSRSGANVGSGVDIWDSGSSKITDMQIDAANYKAYGEPWVINQLEAGHNPPKGNHLADAYLAQYVLKHRSAAQVTLAQAIKLARYITSVTAENEPAVGHTIDCCTLSPTTGLAWLPSLDAMTGKVIPIDH
jgi:hypothetical protein